MNINVAVTTLWRYRNLCIIIIIIIIITTIRHELTRMMLNSSLHSASV